MFDGNDEIEVSPEADIQDIELEDEETQSNNKIKQLRDKLKACEEAKAAALEEMQRAKADFLNAKRRLEDERIADRKKASFKFIEELLPLCDSFNMAMANTEAWNKIDTTWRMGVESIYTQLMQVLKAHNVESIDPQGEDFDPQWHEAMSNEPVNDRTLHHKVIRVLQPGYSMKNEETTEIVRHARVIVGEYIEN